METIASTSWHILTGEYPPEPGGVSDYSAQVAEELHKRGASVHVWTMDRGFSSIARSKNRWNISGRVPRVVLAPCLPRGRIEDTGRVRPVAPENVKPGKSGSDFDPIPEEHGISVHRREHVWSPEGLRRLGLMLDQYPSPRRMLVQYYPNAWGYKGLNVGFARWLKSRRLRGDDIRTVFHEPWYRPEPHDRPWRLILPPVHRLMARGVLEASTTVYVTIPYWETLLRPLSPSTRFVELPVPSNIPPVVDADAVAAIRRTLAREGTRVVGTFGTYREEIAPRLRAILPMLLTKPDRVGLLLGRNGPAFASTLAVDPSRIVATGEMPAREVALHLQACDILVQPYRDGVTGRRGTVMAALCQGLAVVTTTGRMTEPLWSESDCVALASEDDNAAIVKTAEDLLADPERRARLGSRARSVYVRKFALERTMEVLLSD